MLVLLPDDIASHAFCIGESIDRELGLLPGIVCSVADFDFVTTHHDGPESAPLRRQMTSSRMPEARGRAMAIDDDDETVFDYTVKSDNTVGAWYVP